MKFFRIKTIGRIRKDIESVEKIQKPATKLIAELKDLTYTERLKSLNYLIWFIDEDVVA